MVNSWKRRRRPSSSRVRKATEQKTSFPKSLRIDGANTFRPNASSISRSVMMRITRLAATCGAMALVLAGAACGGSDSNNSRGSSGTSGIVGKAAGGKLTFGVKADQPGLGLQTGSTYAGFDIEIAKIIAKGMGVPESGITWKTTVSSNREPYIQQGQVDIVVATYTIT